MPGPPPVSPETALKLSKYLGVPIEHLMHMPRHILLQKLAEMAARDQAGPRTEEPPRGAKNDGTSDPAGPPRPERASGPVVGEPGKDGAR